MRACAKGKKLDRDKYCVFSFIWGILKDKTPKSRQEDGGCQIQVGGDKGGGIGHTYKPPVMK